MYQWLVFLHIIGALLLFMAHGASAAMAFRLRREQDINRIRALLDLSGAALPFMYTGLLLLLVGGIGAGIMGNWFTRGWIWASLVLLIVLVGWMGFYAQRRYIPLRKLVGISYRGETGDTTPPSQDQLNAMIQATNPTMLAIGGFGIGAIILWMMVFKPF